MNRFATTASLAATVLMCSSALAVPEGWTEDVKAAKAEASSTGKDLLMDFTGSDWCGWCIKLHEEVFSQDAFKASVPKEFVLVYLDYPNSVPQSDEVKQQNAELAQKFAIQGYPTIALADAEGKPYAFTGYQEGGPEAYVKHIAELRERRVERDKAMAEAEQAEGIEKAKALDRAMEAVTMEVALQHYGDVVAQIVELDKDNEAGLKEKYAAGLAASKVEGQMQEAVGLLQSGQVDEGLKALDAILAGNPDNQTRQLVLAIQGQVKMQTGDVAGARKALRDSLAVDPQSQLAPNIQQLIDQLPAE